MNAVRVPIVASLLLAPCVVGCEPPSTTDTFVVMENEYPPDSALVIYQAFWQAVSFPDAISPGSSSAPQNTVAASANTAYVLLAPGWDPTSATPPTSFLVLQSRQGYGVHLESTLYIPVGDQTFEGDCASGSPLTQTQADFLTQIVFSSAFAGLTYNAATCTTTTIGDAGVD